MFEEILYLKKIVSYRKTKYFLKEYDIFVYELINNTRLTRAHFFLGTRQLVWSTKVVQLKSFFR